MKNFKAYKRTEVSHKHEIASSKKSCQSWVNGMYLHAVSGRDKSHTSARYTLGGEARTKQHYLQQSCLWMKVFGLLHAWSELKWMNNTVGNHRQKPFIVQLIVLEVVTIHTKARTWNTNELWTHSEDTCRRIKAKLKCCYLWELKLKDEGAKPAKMFLWRCYLRSTTPFTKHWYISSVPKPIELSC